MSDCAVFEEIVKVAVPVLQVLVVIIGWKVVSKGNDRREERKEVRAIVTDIRKVVLEIEARAFEYYQLPQDKGREAGLLLKQQLKHVSMLATSLTRQNPKFDISVAVADFRAAITGGDFESIMRQPRQPTDDLMARIAVAAHHFVDEIEGIFAQQYSAK